MMKDKENHRFFLGVYEIGHLLLYLSRGLKDLGFQVTSIVMKTESPILEREYAHSSSFLPSKWRFIRGLRLIRIFLCSIFTHDVFVFNRFESFLSVFRRKLPHIIHQFAYTDLWILKRLGKTIVVIASGSDIRSNKLLLEEMRSNMLVNQNMDDLRELFMDSPQCDEEMQEHIEHIEKYADHLFTRPIHAQLLSKEFHLLWLPIDLETVEYRVSIEENPLVVHAPSNPELKGTKYILDAVKRLHSEGYQFQFKLCLDKSNFEVRQLLTRSQIAIDQLILPGYALFAIEAMATGNSVLGSAVPGYNGFPEELPIYTTTPSNIYENLKLLLENPQLSYDLAIRGRDYVEKYHEFTIVAERFVQEAGISTVKKADAHYGEETI